MTSSYTQVGKPMSISTPLGADVLLLERAEIIERVSDGFELVLDLLSKNENISVDSLLRKLVTVTVYLEDGRPRYFNGLVRRFIQYGRRDDLTLYRAEVVPATWFLSLTRDCRIYQNKTVPVLVKEVLTAAGITNVRDTLTRSYSTREYCVQYRESHLDFVSRLLEEEGIFYFFEHTADKHVLVLADAQSAIKAGLLETLPSDYGSADPEGDYIHDLVVEQVVVIGKLTLADYNDTLPRRLASNVVGVEHTASRSNLRHYDYPGRFGVAADGEKLARTRMEQAEAHAYVVRGKTTWRGLVSGQKLSISHHYRGDVNKPFSLLAVHHTAYVGAYQTAGDHRPFEYEASFVGIPHSVTYRPPQVTPRPVVMGTQTAVVVGPGGEEIYVDKYGRVKVQFYWDEVGKLDEHSSCWVRVSSAWAGKQWGFIQIPRIGQEVIVDFLEGDPDRPIITGRVYNADQMPPYALPANGTQSGLLTRSSKGGTAANANELRFEDKKGSEMVHFNAEKDLESIVEHDETRTVGNDRTTTIKMNETKTVTEGDEATTISKGNRTFDITQGNETITISAGDQMLTVDQGKQTITVNDNRAITVKKGDQSLEVKEGNVSTKVAMGNVTLKVNLGTITYEAMQKIEFKVGASTITIDQTGIKIKGMMVSVEGQIQTQIKAPMTQVSGDGVLTLKGGITMIN